MLGFNAISSAAISALDDDAGSLPAGRRGDSRDVVLPSQLAGHARRSHNFHTGEFFFPTPFKGKHIRQAYYPKILLDGKTNRQPLPPTGLSFFPTVRHGRHVRQAWFPYKTLVGHTERSYHPPPSRAGRRPKFVHQAPYPKSILDGRTFRHRVPGTGLSSLPVHPRRKVQHQAWFPRELLEGSLRRSFPQQFKELVEIVQCPDLRHAADEASGYELREVSIADVFNQRVDESSGFAVRPDQCR